MKCLSAVVVCLLLVGCGSSKNNNSGGGGGNGGSVVGGNGGSVGGSTSLQLTVSLSGIGTATSNPAGINCPGAYTASFNSGTAITLTATPGSGYNFSGFGGACSGTSCDLTLTANEKVSAVFTQQSSFNRTEYVYTANSGANSISVFQVNSDGTLIPLGAPVSTPASPTMMATVANTLLVGAQQKVNGGTNGTLSLYAIKSGALSFSSSTSLPGLQNVTLDEAGAYAYAISNIYGPWTPWSSYPGAINGYAIGSGSFAPLSGSPYTFDNSSPPGNTPQFLRTAPGNSFLYGIFNGSLGIVTKNADGSLGGFASGSPVSDCGAYGAWGTQPLAVATEPTQTFAFQPCYDGTIGSSSIDPSTGAITATFPAFAKFASSVAVDPSGKWLLAYLYQSPGTVDVLSIDPTTGSVMETSNHQFSVNGNYLAFDHTGRFLYVVSNSNNSITAYNFDAGTDVLTPIQGAQYATGQVPVAMTVAQP